MTHRFLRPAARHATSGAAAVLAACTPRPTAAPAPVAADVVQTAHAAERRVHLAASRLRLCAGGDVSLGTNLDTTWARWARRRIRHPVAPYVTPDSLVAPLRPLFGDADVVVLNIEGAIGEGDPELTKCGPQSTNCFALRAPVAAARAIRDLTPAAVIVGNLANNHALDAGRAGLRTTAAHLEAAGVRVVGLDTLPTVVATARGDTVAVLGFSTSAGPDVRDTAAVRRYVARAAKRFDRVVVTMHLGAEGADAQRTRDTTERFLGAIDRGNPIAFARAAAEGGAVLVVGHGPHVMRAAEWQRGTLTFYSLGNLVTYGPFGFGEPMNRGAVACAVVDGLGQVARAELRPTRQQAPGFVSVDGERRALALVDSLSRLDFPATGVRVRADGTVVRDAGMLPR